MAKQSTLAGQVGTQELISLGPSPPAGLFRLWEAGPRIICDSKPAFLFLVIIGECA